MNLRIIYESHFETKDRSVISKRQLHGRHFKTIVFRDWSETDLRLFYKPGSLFEMIEFWELFDRVCRFEMTLVSRSKRLLFLIWFSVRNYAVSLSCLCQKTTVILIVRGRVRNPSFRRESLHHIEETVRVISKWESSVISNRKSAVVISKWTANLSFQNDSLDCH